MRKIPVVFGVFYGKPEDITEKFLVHEVYPMKLEPVGDSGSFTAYDRYQLENWLSRNFNEYGFMQMDVYDEDETPTSG
jgi:hypothetical protein